MRGKIAWVLVLLVVAVGLAGCGRRGPPQPPAGVPNTYPRAYPGV